MNRPLILFLFLLFFSACKTDENDTLFTSLPASETGLHFSNDLREDDRFNIIKYLYYYNGGGVAIGDVNNDELPDIFLTANQLPNKLFLNRGGMKFEDVTASAGLETPPDLGEGERRKWSTGVTMADVNADGWLDIYVCEVGFYKSVSGRNRLFINQGLPRPPPKEGEMCCSRRKPRNMASPFGAFPSRPPSSIMTSTATSIVSSSIIPHTPPKVFRLRQTETKGTHNLATACTEMMASSASPM